MLSEDLRRARKWAALASGCSLAFAVAGIAGIHSVGDWARLSTVMGAITVGAWAASRRQRSAIAGACLYLAGVALWLMAPAAAYHLPFDAPASDALRLLTVGAVTLGMGAILLAASASPSPHWLRWVAWAAIVLQVTDIVWFRMGRGSSLMGAWAQVRLHAALLAVMWFGADSAAGPRDVAWRVVADGARAFRLSVLLQVVVMAGLLVVGIGAAAGPAAHRNMTIASTTALIALAGQIVIAGVATYGLWRVTRVAGSARRVASLAWSAAAMNTGLAAVAGLLVLAVVVIEARTVLLTTVTTDLTDRLAVYTAMTTGLTYGALAITVGRVGKLLARPRLTDLTTPTLLVIALTQCVYLYRNTSAEVGSTALNLLTIASSVTMILLLLRVARGLAQTADNAALAESFEG